MNDLFTLIFLYILYKLLKAFYHSVKDRRQQSTERTSYSEESVENKNEVIKEVTVDESVPQKSNILKLNSQQNYILSKLLNPIWNPRVVFITGAAGTGKTTLLKEYIKKIQGQNYAIVAPTGIAALNIGGQTIHSFFKFPPRLIRYRHKKDIREFHPYSNIRQVIKKLEYLIIDEISMVRADVMDAIDWSLRINRKINIPFGGVKIIMVGDPLQLEPVVKSEEEEYLFNKWHSPFFFSAKVWLETDFRTFHLTEIMRQADDKKFGEILFDLREGKFEKLHVLNELVLGKQDKEGKEGVILTPTRREAREINDLFLSTLSGEMRVYKGIIEGNFKQTDLPVDTKIRLKIGAKVLLMANDPDGKYVNGDIATVLKLYNNKVLVRLERDKRETFIYPFKWEQIEYVYDREKDEIVPKVVGYFKQLPLRLAWAITIHKSQGLTLDSVFIKLGKGTFAHGQAYVALSRCRSINTLYFDRPLYKEDFIIKEEVKRFIKEIGNTECLWGLKKSNVLRIRSPKIEDTYLFSNKS